jgi:hypothetical protein
MYPSVVDKMPRVVNQATKKLNSAPFGEVLEKRRYS